MAEVPNASKAGQLPPAVQGTRIDYENTSTWPALEMLRTGRKGHRPERSDDLDGREVVLDTAASRVSYQFGTDGEVEWIRSSGTAQQHKGRGRAEVFMIADRLYVTHVDDVVDGAAARTVVLDLARGWAVAAICSVTGPSGETAIAQEFTVAPINGRPPVGQAPSLTSELVGRRVRYDYGDGSVYEHLYLTPHLFTWLCLAGTERGLADTEVCAAYRIRRAIYLFSWREKVVPCAGVVLIDLDRRRTCGSFLGLDNKSHPLFFTWGAQATELARVRYPAALDPAHWRPAATG